MPDSMYDRLGDMLSDALESGTFFSEQHNADNGDARACENPAADAEHNLTAQEKKRKPTAKEQRALTLLGVDESATLDEAKKAYHEKLKYYHPDRHGTNPVLQKVARDKTRQVIEAWATLERYFTYRPL